MTTTDHLHNYLRNARAGVLRALDGLSDYDIRRPMTPTGTNLLGLVKHLASVEIGYLGDCVARPLPNAPAWLSDGPVWDSADMWATADETREDILDLYARACAHSDDSIRELSLHTPAKVDWWPAERQHTTFGELLIRVLEDTGHHGGHADILRELIDNQAGKNHDEVGDAQWWRDFYATIQQAAEAHR